jgi:hypothetical protein
MFKLLKKVIFELQYEVIPRPTYQDAKPAPNPGFNPGRGPPPSPSHLLYKKGVTLGLTRGLAS